MSEKPCRVGVQAMEEDLAGFTLGRDHPGDGGAARGVIRRQESAGYEETVIDDLVRHCFLWPEKARMHGKMTRAFL